MVHSRDEAAFLDERTEGPQVFVNGVGALGQHALIDPAPQAERTPELAPQAGLAAAENGARRVLKDRGAAIRRDLKDNPDEPRKPMARGGNARRVFEVLEE